MTDELAEAIELARLAAPFRSYAGTGGIWHGRRHDDEHQYMPDARFDDWGLARATAIILNAVLDGSLTRKD